MYVLECNLVSPAMRLVAVSRLEWRGRRCDIVMFLNLDGERQHWRESRNRGRETISLLGNQKLWAFVPVEMMLRKWPEAYILAYPVLSRTYKHSLLSTFDTPETRIEIQALYFLVPAKSFAGIALQNIKHKWNKETKRRSYQCFKSNLYREIIDNLKQGRE